MHQVRKVAFTLREQKYTAQDATCLKCHRHGHFQAMCQTKSLQAVRTEDSEE